MRYIEPLTSRRRRAGLIEKPSIEPGRTRGPWFTRTSSHGQASGGPFVACSCPTRSEGVSSNKNVAGTLRKPYAHQVSPGDLTLRFKFLTCDAIWVMRFHYLQHKYQNPLLLGWTGLLSAASSFSFESETKPYFHPCQVT